MKIHPRVTQINTCLQDIPVELYLITGKINAIIDTGTSKSPQNDIAPALKALGLTLADIDLILNTHGHIDHAGGDAAVKSASGAQIFIHPDEIGCLKDHEGFFDQNVAPAVEAILGKEQVDEVRAFFLEMAGQEVAADRQLKDNEVIDLGDGCHLRVIHLPGHTSGSVGFYWEEEGMLFSGDCVMGLFDGSGMLPIIADFAAYESSLQRLQGLPLRLILQAEHGRGITRPPSPIVQSEEIKQYLQDSHEVAERIVEVVRQVAPDASGKPFMEVANEVIARLPKEMDFKPISQLPMPLFGGLTIFAALSQTN